MKIPMAEIRAKHFPDRSIDAIASAVHRARKLDLVEQVIGHPDFDDDRPEEEDDIIDLTHVDMPPFDRAILDTPLTLYEANFSPSWWFYRPEISAVFVVILRIPHFSHFEVFMGQDRKSVKVDVTVFLPDDGVEVLSARTGIAYTIIKHTCRETPQSILLSFASPVDNPQILSKPSDPLHIIRINIPTQIAPIKLD
eukprot:Phypoly_transcript_17964.p1 GENE.Phypoly_transcript_17964~~Phypoly_transcript_17964.p1  ORF type:complete len:196 (+),score=31.47 Phypoly_transcript_17964:156-743(+)